MPKLFVEYIGMGNSDKPKDYAYSTAERTDLVEAIWKYLSVRSTTLVAFDFSAIVGVVQHRHAGFGTQLGSRTRQFQRQATVWG